MSEAIEQATALYNAQFRLDDEALENSLEMKKRKVCSFPRVTPHNRGW